jgi:nucleoside-diphosphate-sugar epimerase
MNVHDHLPRQSKSGAHLVTGSTGFVGRALVLELLDRTDDDVVCLVRNAGEESKARRRLYTSLLEAADAYGADARVRSAIESRCHAVPGDLSQDLSGIAERWLGRIDQVWHCAASLHYLERDRALIESVNVDGTLRMLRLAAELGAEGFHFVSTAFVVGKADGNIAEEAVTTATSNNVYEESKLRAEHALLDLAAAGPRITILRPGTVVGHSRTYAVSGTLSGMYGLARVLQRYHRRVNLLPGPVRIVASSAATIDLVPIDRVAREAVACGLRGEHRGVYHLTSGGTIPLPGLMATISQATGTSPVTLIDDPNELRAPAEHGLNRLLNFYRAHMYGDKRFSRTHTNTIVGEAPIGISESLLEDLLRHYQNSSG